LNKLTKQEQENLDKQITPLNGEFRSLIHRLNNNNNNNNEEALSNANINRKNLQLTLEYLTKSAQLDPNQNLTWYYLGRAFACKGDSTREAFISYKNSVSNPDVTGNTWCSIGVLYYQQQQYMDALQAFVCAIQLDHKQYSSWLNLAILYENDFQIEEALKCYKLAIKCKLSESKDITREETNSDSLEYFINLDIENNLDYLSNEKKYLEIVEEDKLNKEELKFVLKRIKLLIQYLNMSQTSSLITKEKVKKLQSNSRLNLPNLKEAFALQIPTELRQKIINMNQQENVFNNMTLGLNINGNNVPITQLVSNSKDSNNTMINVLAAQKQHKLKPQQIQLMNQLEANKNQLNHDQLQMLNALKSQFLLSTQSHNSVASIDNIIPLDLENVQPITMMQEDQLLQETTDLNTLLSRHDIVEDLRMISDDDKGTLDHILNTNKPAVNNGTKLPFSSDNIKLDSTLTNGSTIGTKDPSTNGLVELTDDDILASKLNIQMTADEIINACKPYGLNGIQNNFLLKPNRSKKRTLKYLNESDLIDDKKVEIKKKQKKTQKLIEEIDIEFEDADSDHDNYYDDSDTDEIDDSFPYGSVTHNLEKLKQKLEENYIKNNTNKNIVNLPGPSVILETKKDAQSPHLQYFCLSHPISVVRGLGHVLRLDLSLFSTKTLVETDPDHLIEVRNQRQQPSDENWDLNGKQKVWKCKSTPSYISLLKYAQYQASSFQEAVKEEKMGAQSTTSNNSKLLNNSSNSQNNSPNLFSNNNNSNNLKKSFKSIKFGTNLDLSDEKKWQAQFQEMAKLPAFMRVVSSSNMLSHVGYKIYGCNTLQMYLKVPGCRTPGHQENNNFCSLNLNIGPGDCEWFGVDEKYWQLIEELCEKNSCGYLNGSWWPNLDDLHAARIPVFRFLQKPGDLVWVNAGCIHWVQSVGWCNNVSWNVGPTVYLQYKSAMERYEWNKLRFYKSIIPMIHLTWNLARNVKITDRRLFEYIKYVLMHSLKQCQLAINYIENCGCELKYQARQSDEPAHYCYDCDCEVFNILFVSEQPVDKNNSTGQSSLQQSTQHVVHCQSCARKRTHLLENFVMLNQYSMDELKQIYNQFQLYVPSLQNILSSSNSSISTANTATTSSSIINSIESVVK
jgi:hypothetical protein